MKRWLDVREAQRTRADNVEAQLRLHRLALERVHEAATAVATGLGLEPRPLQSRGIGDIANFLAHLVGQLEALPELLTARARREGRQVVEATAPLLRLYFLFLLPLLYSFLQYGHGMHPNISFCNR